MKKIRNYISIILVFVGLISSGQDLKKYRVSMDNIFELDSSNYVLIPVGWETNATFQGIKISGSGYKNILVYNKVTDDVKPMFEDSIQIINYLRNRYNDNSKIKTYLGKYFVLNVTIEDYNKDRWLNYSDPSYLFVYNLETGDLRQMSPRGCDLKEYIFIESEGTILATFISDTNKDKDFNDNDSELLYKIDLENPEKNKVLYQLKIKKEKQYQD